jgi:hypothetical protein
VSVVNNKQEGKIDDGISFSLTMFVCKASPRYCAPFSPMSFEWRLSVASVCVEQQIREGR